MSGLLWLVVLGLCALGFVRLARRVEQSLLYHPDPTYALPSSALAGGRVREISLQVAPNVKVFAWYLPAADGRPTLLYFHGNGGSLIGRSDVFERYASAGVGVFMMSYRGYSGSTGMPSQRANIADALLAYDALCQLGVSARDIVVYGESLGTGVAVQLATKRSVAGVILDAPYTAIVDVAELHYPYLPARWFMRDRYLTRNFIVKLSAPLLVVHGEADVVIPVEMGHALAKAAGGPADIKTYPGAGHTNHTEFGSFADILDWLDQLVSDERRAAQSPHDLPRTA